MAGESTAGDEKLWLYISAPRYADADHAGVSGVYAFGAKLDSFAVEFGLSRLDVGAVKAISFANPKISLRVSAGKTGLEYYAFIPVATRKNEARLYGLIASPENVGAYLANSISGGATLSRSFSFRKLGYKQAVNDLKVSMSGGALVLIATKRVSAEDRLEILIPYAIGLTDYRGNLVLGGELAGTYVLTQTAGSFGDNVLSQFQIFLGWRLGNLTAAPYIKFPVDKTTDRLLRNTLGVNIAYQ